MKRAIVFAAVLVATLLAILATAPPASAQSKTTKRGTAGIIRQMQPLLMQAQPVQQQGTTQGSSGTRVPFRANTPGSGWLSEPGTQSTSPSAFGGLLLPATGAATGQPGTQPGSGGGVPIRTDLPGSGWQSGTGSSGGVQQGSTGGTGFFRFPGRGGLGQGTTATGSTETLPSDAAVGADALNASSAKGLHNLPEGSSSVVSATNANIGSLGQPATIAGRRTGLLPPLMNELRLDARPITSGEIQAAEVFFKTRFQKLTEDLQQVLGIGADASQNDALAKTIKGLHGKSLAGALSGQDVAEARRVLTGAKLALDRVTLATRTLAELDQQIAIAKAVSTAQAGEATDRLPLPPGIVSVIANPKLPIGNAIVLGAGQVMVGSGGKGDLRLFNDTAVRALGLPVESTSPLPEIAEKPVLQGILLVNPAGSKKEARYVIEEVAFKMPPGSEHVIPGAASLTVDFDRGDNLGRRQYGLSAGTYHFTSTQEGWELYEQSFEVLVDNRANAQAFNYIVQNERAVVGPGQTASHTSKYPIVIRFDRGNGAAVKQVKVDAKTIKVAISGSDYFWDLFPASAEGKKSEIIAAF